MQKINGIILVTIAFFSSFFLGCSQEDDYYDSDMYTLAEQMDTRTAESGGGHKKKKILWFKQDETINLPKGTLDSIPVLYGEYDDEALSVSISNFSGRADVYVLALPLNNVMNYNVATFVNNYQFDFSLTGYTHGATYQVYVGLDNGEAYAGEFDL